MEARTKQPAPLLRRRGVRLGLLAAGLLLAVAAGALYYFRPGRSAERHHALAAEALAAEDLPAACEHLRSFLEARPDSAEGHFLLAQTLRRRGEYDEAKRHLDEAARLGWDRAAVRREASLARLQQEVRETSGRELIELVGAARPPDRPTLEALYRGDLAARNWDRAGLWLHLWLESYPDDWAPRLWQADLLAKFKKYDQARADYRRVLELRPDHPAALLGAGLVALDARADYAEAEKYLGRLLALRPGHPEATLGLARCAFGRGDLAAARKGALEVLAAHPDDAGAALLLGQAEAEAGRDEEAERWLRQAEAGGADRGAVSYLLDQVLRRLGRPEEAQVYQRRFAEWRDAKVALERAIRAAEREPKNAPLQYEVGRLTLAAGEPDFAAQWFVRALKQDPKHRPSHAALADYYAGQPGRLAAEQADWHRRAAAGADPQKPE